MRANVSMPSMAAGSLDRVILGCAAALLIVSFVCGLGAPPVFWGVLAASVGVGLAFLAYRHLTGFCVVWLLITSASLELGLSETFGEQMFQSTIAVVKGVGFVLAGLCCLRFGLRGDMFNPIWAYLMMLGFGFVHGLYPGLTVTDSLRSLIGSVAPFAFGFCRPPKAWGEAIIRTTKWCPVAVVAACVPLALAGIRPLFVESFGLRLSGLGHPAFLANVCLPAIYACLIQLYRQGRRSDLFLLAANVLILVLTGARAPLAYAVAVTGLSFVSIRSTIFPPRHRLLPVLAVGALLPLIVLAAGQLGEIRLFKVVLNEAVNLSGRTLLWGEFENASDQSPWFGWGIGAGNVVIPRDDPVAQLLRTWAAHKEYLRMEVEGGQIGRALLIGLFVAWVVVHTRPLPTSDRRIMRLVFMAFAAHAMTDNVLISTPACVLFVFATAVFCRADEPPTPLVLPGHARLS